MKAYRWINKYNHKNSLKIIRKYSFGVQSGRSTLFSLHPSFWLKYLLRLVLVFFSLILFKKSTYRTFFKLFGSPFSQVESPHGKSSLIIKLKDFIVTLFGYRLFLDDDTYPLLSERVLKKKYLTLPLHNSPTVSIIIPVFNHLDYTYNCLLSIKEHVAEHLPYEIIIIDDCSEDYTPVFFSEQVKGVKYLRNDKNVGFLSSCNEGAALAEGTFICFLNNDTQVRKNWLESLLRTFEQDNIGVVGSQLVYANGILQEAGGLIFSDGSAANYGRYEPLDHPNYNYAREVDYCSGASILIRKKDFDLLGQFDSRYIPAYYEDTDLCMSVRHVLKKKVMYQPLSSVIHFEGISSGTDIEKHPVKRFQNINKLKFIEKWSKELASYPKSCEFQKAVDKFYIGKIVMIDHSIPEPDKDSGSVRLKEIIKILISIGYKICFMPNDGLKRDRYFEELIGIGVMVIHKYPNRNGMLLILQQQLSNTSLVWVCKPHTYASLQSYFTDRHKVIYDTVDLHYVRMGREAELLNSTVLKNEANDMKEQEISFAKKSALTITVTSEEKACLRNEGINNVAVVPNIHIPNISNSFNPFSERKGLLFIGGYAHKPNVDAAKWLINEIMPLVWAKDSSIPVTLLGSNPPAEVLALNANKVAVPGYIEEVGPYFNDSRIFIAPLRYGAGMKGKIGQSLSYALPIITTDIGAEGIGLTPNKDFILANSVEEFADKISLLYNDEKLWTDIADRSKKIIAHYSPKQISKTIQSFLSELN